MFTFAMLALVTSDNFLQLFFGWEGVGLASYLLIGFWYLKPEANAAAIKAFIVNRIGDFGFALGIFGVFAVFGTIGFDAVFRAAPGVAGKPMEFLGYQLDTLTVLCLLLFMGAMGKSAQFLLHTWLPDAMEGPTPVSALIHAATMVTAGVFMVARLSPLFEQAPVALQVVTLVGAVTAFFAATVGLVQNDIKRVVAYSTCSQLGYMFVACGVGAYSAGIFHLFTHAFFKALLFLGAGSVIHAMHHEQDMRKMGGLAPKLRITWAVMLIGTLSLTGVGIPHLLGFAGFYSKDAIIEAAFAAHTPSQLRLLAAGDRRLHDGVLLLAPDVHDLPPAHARRPPHLRARAREPVGHAAAAPGAGAGLGRRRLRFQLRLHRRRLRRVLARVAGRGPAQPHPPRHARDPRLGGLGAVRRHGRGLRPLLPLLHGGAVAAGGDGARLQAALPVPAQQVVLRRALRLASSSGPPCALGRLLWKRGDGTIIDGLGADNVAARVLWTTGRVVKLQTGYVYHYAFAMLIGVALIVTAFMFNDISALLRGVLAR